MPWIIILVGYCLGAIPTAYIAGRLHKDKDIWRMGDGNVGAANAYRQLGPKTGVAVGIIDAGKGALAIIVAQTVSLTEVAVMLTGVAVVAGHNWSPFIGFKGGRGLSTTIGVMLALITQPMLILLGPALPALLIKRNATIASCVLFIPLPLLCWWLGVHAVLISYSVALPSLVGITDLVKRRQLAHTSGAGSA
jgi:glycerol-3-phosphate acyltransferase PlsY